MTGSNQHPGPTDLGRKLRAQGATIPSMRMRLITLYVQPYYLERLEDLVRAKFYPNRSEAIRFAIRDLIMKEAL